MRDRVRVWLVPVALPPRDLTRCLDVLDDEERSRSGALTRREDRERFVVAHGALRLLVARALGDDPRRLRWTRGPHGKPALIGPDSLPHTNLSHTEDLVMVGFSASRPVGVDVQRVTTGLDPIRLSARFFAPAEARYVADAPDRPSGHDRYTHLWCRKEAAVKASGGRLWPNLGVEVRDRDLITCVEPVATHRVTDVPAPSGFRAAVALLGTAPYRMEATLVHTLEASSPEGQTRC